MARPNWEYIRVDVLLPEHPKLEGLSRSGRWTLIEMWLYCGRLHTDGIITEAKWKTFGTAGERRQILDAGLAEKISLGGYIMHDFIGPDGHQRSRQEIDELSAKRAAAGRKGGSSGSKHEASA